MCRTAVSAIPPAGGASGACLDASRKQIFGNSAVITNENHFLEVFKAVDEFIFPSPQKRELLNSMILKPESLNVCSIVSK